MKTAATYRTLALVTGIWIQQPVVAATPDPPSGLRAWPLSEDAIQLEWTDEADNETSYEVQRRSAFNDPWQLLVDNLPENSTTHTDSGLPPSSAYQYRIVARSSEGTGTSNPARAQTDDRPYGMRTLSFQNGMGRYEGTVDLGIVQTDPTTVDTGAYVWVDNNSVTDERQALVQFEGIFGSNPDKVPAGAKVDRAILRIYLGTNSNAQSYKPINFHRMLVPWDIQSPWDAEAWGGFGVQVNDVEALSQFDAVQFFGKTDEYYDLDVTQTVQAWADGAGQHGWLIRTNFSDGYAYYTSHNPVTAFRPQLIVRFDNDPDNDYPQVDFAGIPADGAGGIPEPALVGGTVTDPEGQSLQAAIYGRMAPVSDEEPFSVVLMPDTQFYSAEIRGGSREIFFKQTDWIVDNVDELGIAFVLHLGDIVQSGDIKGDDSNGTEWYIAYQAMNRLRNVEKTGLPEGVPFAVNVGNHDQEPIWRSSGTTRYFNNYFGVRQLERYSYYGGHYGENNDNHYYLFEAGGFRFIVISLEYHDPARDPIDPALLEWADQLLKDFPGHRGIIVSHHMVNPGYPATWSPYGEALYEVLKDNPNLHFMFGGHVTGEGLKVNEFQGNTVYAMVQDYQALPNGGSGYLRLLTFSPVDNEVRFLTYSPWLDRELEDFGGPLTLSYDLGTVQPPFALLADFENLNGSGTAIRFPWETLPAETEFEWFLEVSDGRKTTRTEPRAFRTAKSTYTSWRIAYFGDLDPEGDRLADPDKDGLSNELEYLYATDPMIGDPIVRGRVIQPTLNASGDLVLQYQRPTGTGFEWRYETSTDILNWVPVDPELISEQVELLEDGTETVRINLGPQATASRFWRVLAGGPPVY